MQLYYYVQRGEEQFGPYLSDALLDYIAQGNIALNDLVFLEDSQTWTSLENTPLIQNLFGTAQDTQNEISTTESPSSETTNHLPEVPRRPVTIEPELDLEMIETAAVSAETNLATTEETTTTEVSAEVTTTAEVTVEETTSEVVAATKPSITAVVSPKTTTSAELLDLIFNEGIAQIEIEPTAKGQVTVGVEDGKSDSLTIEVRAARAARLVLQNEERQAVGNLASVIVTAEDEFGNIDEDCNAELTIKYSGSAMGVGRIQLKNGIGNFGVSNEKATVSSFVVGAIGQWTDLKATDGAIEFVAGPAIRFEIVAPATVQAGQKTQVQVMALDQFGNQTSRVEADVRLAIQHFVS